MEDWLADIQFERLGFAARLAKKALINPLANYLPAEWIKTWLRQGRSELALANWTDPGGWRSMVISYEGNPQKPWDRILVGGGTIPMALRNRKRLAGRLFARMIDQANHDPARVLCLGAGPGITIMEAMAQAGKNATATLVDLSSDAFDFGRDLAGRHGLGDRVRFVQADVRDVKNILSEPVDLVTMVGICEYLQDEQIVAIAAAAGEVMSPGTSIVFNSISKRHGTDRFFRRVFGLHMNHRTAEHLQGLLARAGFGEFVGFPEPLGVYEVMVGKMASPPADSTKGAS